MEKTLSLAPMNSYMTTSALWSLIHGFAQFLQESSDKFSLQAH